MQRLGFRVAALVAAQDGQVVQAFGDIRVLGPQGLLADRQSSFGQRLGFRIAALIEVQVGQDVDVYCNGQRLLLKRSLSDFYHLFGDGFRGGVLALASECIELLFKRDQFVQLVCGRCCRANAQCDGNHNDA